MAKEKAPKEKKKSYTVAARERLFIQQPILHRLYQDYRNSCAKLSRARSFMREMLEVWGEDHDAFLEAQAAEVIAVNETIELLDQVNAAQIPISGTKPVKSTVMSLTERRVTLIDQQELKPIEGFEVWEAAGQPGFKELRENNPDWFNDPDWLNKIKPAS